MSWRISVGVITVWHWPSKPSHFTGSSKGLRFLSRKHSFYVCRFTFILFAESRALYKPQSQTQQSASSTKTKCTCSDPKIRFRFQKPWKRQRAAPLHCWILSSLLWGSCVWYHSLLFADSRQTVVCKNYFRRPDVSANMKLQPHPVWSFWFLFFNKVYFCMCFGFSVLSQNNIKPQLLCKATFKVRRKQTSCCVKCEKHHIICCFVTTQYRCMTVLTTQETLNFLTGHSLFFWTSVHVPTSCQRQMNNT